MWACKWDQYSWLSAYSSGPNKHVHIHKKNPAQMRFFTYEDNFFFQKHAFSPIKGKENIQPIFLFRTKPLFGPVK